MTYHGYVENGRVVLDESTVLPEGARVCVVVDSSSDPKSPALQWLSENAVMNDVCPGDLADQHDHYLYGVPKKDR